VSAINPLVAFYDIHGGKREVLFFYFVLDTTRDKKSCEKTVDVKSKPIYDIHNSHAFRLAEAYLFVHHINLYHYRDLNPGPLIS
jgi:hypothetical protein